MNFLEPCLKELSEIRSSGPAVKETSYYGLLANLLNEIGKTLKPILGTGKALIGIVILLRE
ncbi:MAG: hypothetical protein ACLQUW_10190 [Desulfobaccales bacterium]